MPLGKDKKSVQAYVSTGTKEKIVKLAESQNRSESYIAGKMLDESCDNKTELLLEELECVKMWLNKMNAPTEREGKTLSVIGRITGLLMLAQEDTAKATEIKEGR